MATARLFVALYLDADVSRKLARAGREHYGVIVSEQLLLGEMLRRLLRLLDAITADEMKNSFRNLGEFK